MRSFVLLAVGLMVSGFVACSSSNTPSGPLKPGAGEGGVLPNGQVFKRAELLHAFGQCAQQHAQKFTAPASALVAALEAAKAEPSEAQLAAAQGAYRAAFTAWQPNEVLQYGPGAVKDRSGGRDFRDHIYSWPLTSRCAVDQRLHAGNFADGLDQALVTVRGLDAIEYVLFADGAGNGCPSDDPMNTDGSWAARSPEQLRALRLDAALAAAKLLPTAAQELADAWDPAKGNFLAEFSNAGKGSRTFGSDSIALNTVSDALFYIEYELKDMKLAHPMGLRMCDTVTCPEDVESPHAKLSLSAIRANLLGARYLLEGCGEGFEGLGFDDMLRAVEQNAMADEMVRATKDAITAADAIEGDDLAAAIANQRPQVDALYAAVKRITDRLKTDFLSVLDLEVARTVEGDND